jgi:hypothetical protein
VSEGWIDEDNLRLFVDALAHFSGTSFDDDDWIGLEHDLILCRDQSGRERHTQWPLASGTLDLYYEPGESVVTYTLHANPTLEAQADALSFVLQQTLGKPDP